MTALLVFGVVPAQAGTYGAEHCGFWNMDARFRGHDGERVGVDR
jgi:hypothetical protein